MTDRRFKPFSTDCCYLKNSSVIFDVENVRGLVQNKILSLNPWSEEKQTFIES